MKRVVRTTGRVKIVEQLKGGIAISCQADPGNPLNSPTSLAALAQCAEMGGARAFRVDGPENIRAVRSISDLPIIGIAKVDRPGFDVRITPTFADALPLLDAGANIVALDGTQRLRPGGQLLADIIERLHDAGAAVMADISTVTEARQAVDSGADMIATTLSGYTPHSQPADLTEPDFVLLKDLRTIGAPVVAEGRIWTPEHVEKCFSYGVHAIVVGSAVTVPERITRRLVQASPSARNDLELGSRTGDSEEIADAP